VVHAALQPERPSGERRRGGVRDQRVAWRGAQALPQPVHHTQRDHLPRGAGDRDDRPHDHGREIAEHDQRPAQRHAVRQSPRRELHERRGELRRAVEGAQRLRARSQHPRQEGGQERVDHLAREIVEQRDRAEQLHLAR